MGEKDINQNPSENNELEKKIQKDNTLKKDDEFNHTIGIISEVLNKIGTTIDVSAYDGFFVKKLAWSNTYPDLREKKFDKEGKETKTNQTHIAITGEQMDLFPSIYSECYFNGQDNDMKQFFMLQVPVILSRSNYIYLNSNAQKEIEIIFDSEEKEVYTAVVRSKRLNGYQIELSRTEGEGKEGFGKDHNNFLDFRCLLPTDTYLIVLKHKNCVKYSVFGVLSKDSGDLYKIKQRDYLYRTKSVTPINIKSFVTIEEERDTSNQKLLSVDELTDEVRNMYINGKNTETAKSSVHMFGIKYGESIKALLDSQSESSISSLSEKLRSRANLPPSFGVVIKEGYDIYISIFNNVYGVSFSLNNNLVTDTRKKSSNIKGRNIILYGVPGSGKSYTIEKEYCKDEAHMERVVFHPDYTYSDFVGQIKPVLNEEKNKLEYKFIPGPFTNILKRAINEGDTSYYLIIEEINRGNAPAIFGDIFQLLDRKGDGSSKYGITNEDIAREIYGDEKKNTKIIIPSNLYLLATMNTSDQNVFALDTAFQRRWNMRLISNEFRDDDLSIANTKILDTGYYWHAFLKVINKKIIQNRLGISSSEDKRLGTHFVSESDLTIDNGNSTSDKIIAREYKNLASDFAEKILKYLWDDAFKYSRDEIFDGNYDSLEKLVRDFVNSKEDERFNIFNEDIRKLIRSENKQMAPSIVNNISSVTKDGEKNEEITENRNVF